ncbi:hypothetical protein D3C85_1566750 [compost metagenome]
MLSIATSCRISTPTGIGSAYRYSTRLALIEARHSSAVNPRSRAAPGRRSLNLLRLKSIENEATEISL